MTQTEYKVWNKLANTFLEGTFTPHNDLNIKYQMDDLVFCPSTYQVDSNNNIVFAGDILKSDVDDKYYYWVVMYTEQGLICNNITPDGSLVEGLAIKAGHFVDRSVIGNIFETPIYLTGKRQDDEIFEQIGESDDSTKFVSLLKKICEEHGYEGGILILDRFDDKGQQISTFGLSHIKTRECLSITSYYNERLLLERGEDISNPLNSFTHQEHENN